MVCLGNGHVLCIHGILYAASWTVLKLNALNFLQFLEVPDFDIVVSTTCSKGIAHRIKSHRSTLIRMSHHLELNIVWNVIIVLNHIIILQL